MFDFIREKLKLHRTEEGRIQYEHTTIQEVEALLEQARYRRDMENALGVRRGSEMRHFARLGPVQVLEIKAKYGIDVFNLTEDDRNKLQGIVEREYPLLKTTNRRLIVPRGG